MRMSCLYILGLSLLITAGSSFAEGPGNNASGSVYHSAEALVHASAAGTQIVSVAAAIPFAFGAEVGAVSGKAAQALSSAAEMNCDEALEISEDIPTRHASPGHRLQESEL